MVDLGFSGFALGAVAGWSALFLRAPVGFVAALFAAGLWLGWALLLYGLAVRMGVPMAWLWAGVFVGASGHGVMIFAILKRGRR